PVDVRRLVFAILAFTFGSELIGAVLLSGLWADKPPAEQAYYSLFHAVSAFCNAGFDLTGRSFLGLGTRWQVWGVIAGLVIVGGLGFGTLYNLSHAALTRLRWGRRAPAKDRPLPFGPKVASGRPARLTVTTRLVLLTTALLLAAGTAWHYVFEAAPGGTAYGLPPEQRLADAWFQSVIYRTAGFNTVDHAQLRPATKLVAVVLMFIGAAPVSCGGGVKTAAVAVVALAFASIMRGRPHAEAFGRAIPDEVVKRALAVVILGAATLITVTLALTAFEDGTDIPPLDLLFESASACGTVGVSTGITPRLSPASQVVLIVAMFLGRVGPLTLLLGLAGQRQVAEYDYPEERVTLG
ncbi:MAG TPA: potassium transporter TrkG, partial [Planctomycetaceae bacterium]